MRFPRERICPHQREYQKQGEVDTEGHGLEYFLTLGRRPAFRRKLKKKGRKREVHALPTHGTPRPENHGDVRPGPISAKTVLMVILAFIFVTLITVWFLGRGG